MEHDYDFAVEAYDTVSGKCVEIFRSPDHKAAEDFALAEVQKPSSTYRYLEVLPVLRKLTP